jgi:hypothetical protein
MIHAQDTRQLIMDNSGTTIRVSKNPAAATNSSAKWTSLQLEEGTTTDATNHTAINGFIGTTNATASATQFVLPGDNTTTYDEIILFHVNLADKERFLMLNRQAATGYNTIATQVTLSRGKESPNTTTEMGVNAVVIG